MTCVVKQGRHVDGGRVTRLEGGKEWTYNWQLSALVMSWVSTLGSPLSSAMWYFFICMDQNWEQF